MSNLNSVGSSISSGIATGGTSTSAPSAGTQASQVAVSPVAGLQGRIATDKPSAVSVQNAVNSINQAFQQNGTNMQFSIDPGTKEDVVQVTDTSTGQVIWQIPSKVTLGISAAIAQEMTRGALLYQKA